MRKIVTQQFENLYKEYQEATSRDDRKIRCKLEEIIACHKACDLEEREFSEDIIDKFCEMIAVMKSQYEQELANIREGEEESFLEPGCNLSGSGNLNHFVAVRPETPTCWISPINQEDIPYCDGEELLVAFYNRYRNESKKGDRVLNNPPIEHLDELRQITEVNLTIRDYVARIRTFAKLYLEDIPLISKIYFQEQAVIMKKYEDVLFVYKYLEHIIPSFNTKKETGEADKQKVNIRSALKKLNEFKLEQRMNQR